MIYQRNMEVLNAREIKEFMLKHGISKNELSEILGVTIQAVNLWLKDKREFNLTNSRLLRIMNKYPQLIKEF